MKRLLFLDVDGVLNRLTADDARLATLPTPDMPWPFVVELNTVATFAHVLKQVPELKLVVSSTWRSFFNDARDFAWATQLPVDLFHERWRTPPAFDRGKEIAEWLQDHEPAEYVVLDDNDDGISSLHGKRLIRTNPQLGLTLPDLEKVLRRFKYKLRSDLRIVTLGGPVEDPLPV